MCVVKVKENREYREKDADNLVQLSLPSSTDDVELSSSKMARDPGP